jgi:hypothetical protein
MFKKIFLSALMGLAVSTPACRVSGADLPSSLKDGYTPGTVLGTASGFYVAGFGGWQVTDAADRHAGMLTKLNTGSNGGTLLGRVGWDVSALNSGTYGRWLVGVYGEGGYNDMSGPALSMRETWNYGAGTRVGFKWGSSLVYGLVGYSATEAKPENTGWNLKQLSGIKIGGGFETPLSQHLYLVSELTGTGYSPYRHTHAATDDADAYTEKFSPNDFGGHVGLAYRW